MKKHFKYFVKHVVKVWNNTDLYTSFLYQMNANIMNVGIVVLSK